MYFNDGRVMSPAEEGIYWRLGEDERPAFLAEGTAGVELTQREATALEREWEAEVSWLRRQELIAFLSD